MNKKSKDKVNNLVAKYCMEYNKATVQRDRKNDYTRKQKHRYRSSDNRLLTLVA